MFDVNVPIVDGDTVAMVVRKLRRISKAIKREFLGRERFLKK